MTSAEIPVARLDPSLRVPVDRMPVGFVTSDQVAAMISAAIGSSPVNAAAVQAMIDASIAPLAPKADPALTGNPTAPTQAAGNNSTRLATTAYVDQLVITISRLPAGAEWPVRCYSDVQPTRASITSRTDISLIWEMSVAPSFATGYALAGVDQWRRRTWV